LIKLSSKLYKSSIKQAIYQILFSYIPFLALIYVCYLVIDISYWIVFILTIPASFFLVRIFVIAHDCSHRSFTGSRKFNNIVGTISAFLNLTPFYAWTEEHRKHHMSSGNLDTLDIGEFTTLTVKEYKSMSMMRKLGYRLYRNPFVLLTIGPVLYFLVRFRFSRSHHSIKAKISVYMTNLALLGIFAIIYFTFDIIKFLLIFGPLTVMASIIGTWLFFIQHQFPEAYFRHFHEWNFQDAGMKGSSFYDLPKIVMWFTGNITYHHIHHLAPKIPFYHLGKCYKNSKEFKNGVKFSFFQSLPYACLALYDKSQGRLVSFKSIKD